MEEHYFIQLIEKRIFSDFRYYEKEHLGEIYFSSDLIKAFLFENEDAVIRTKIYIESHSDYLCLIVKYKKEAY